ncbi:MAG: [FeFe] hydrogenase H-cluster maturation GTPase HydF [Clostridiaceae bacterium]|nr:[FeFe] hydrogenase H-cluster maturation GTPase HydF [Clostridiaceae bacterium]HPU45064.1 [FeFe] hydrogenase H-cluster maturation GTPase HydF [Thermoclostridium sp.]
MGLNATPSANRIHIGFFGKRNSGKSSLVNAVTGQDLAVVSDVKGTTTDPVYKAMELLPLGPVVIIDTAGIDDEGALGELRVRKTQQVLNKTDIAVLVIDSTAGKTAEDEELIAMFEKKNIPYVIACNKSDLLYHRQPENEHEIYVSARTGYNINELKEKIAALSASEDDKRRIVGDLISPMDFVVLVIPIDKAAPKGRLILPQQQTIRDILDAGAVAISAKETELKETLEKLGKKPRLVITDSQVFEKVAAETPDDVFLTSFSILFARYKGNLKTAVEGARTLDKLRDGDTVLISEGCTHHRQCDDIGTVKLPRWIKEYTKKQLEFRFTSGTEFPEDLPVYNLIVHCGGCMLNEREMKYRIQCAVDQGVPITNYGILIAYMKGILERSIAIFPDL